MTDSRTDAHACPPAVGPRRTLPLRPADGGPHGSRSWATCFYRCGNACDKPEPNRSDNPHVQDVITTALRRRAVLGGAAAGVGTVVLGGLGSAAAAGTPEGRGGGHGHGNGHGRGDRVSTDDFRPVAPNTDDAVTVPRGYTSAVVAAWGDAVLPGAPRFDVHRQTPESAAQQFGYNNDYVGVLPLGRSSALLVCNHEYTNEEIMFPAGAYSADEQRRIALASHGMSVLRIEKGRRGGWSASRDRRTYNRRITGETPFAVDGPAAGSARLRTSADPSGRTILGTLNNCAGGTTPWGTVLSGEENVNQYFGTTGEIPADRAEAFERYGISAEGERGWHLTWDRFDVAKEPNEPNRFGWIVEIDPYDRDAAPVKHTMLGRFKHEGANVQLAHDGRAVVYMGDDERGDYLYRFVSTERMRRGNSRWARRHNQQLLTRGTLSVARLSGDGTADGEWDGTGEWVPLTSDRESFVPGWSVVDVLVDTRLAADTVAPTRMDRPEDVEPNPVNGRIYAALTNNSDRGTAYPTDEANPLASSKVRPELGAPLEDATGNRNGYVLELEPGRDRTSSRFTWRLFLVCGDPEAPETYFGGFPKDQVSPISCPDNVAFDSVGNLWVSTDGNALGSHDGIFRVPVAGRSRGKVEQFLTVPIGAEACGPLITDGDQHVWLAVQHPGEGGTFAAPTSLWPHTDRFPRPAVVVTWKR